MIKVIYQLSKQNPNYFNYLEVQGHANYAPKGKDLVCAGVSAIVNGTINFLQKNYADFCLISCQPSLVKISWQKGKEKLFQQNKGFQLCLQMFFSQLKNISYYYPNYLGFEVTF